MTARKSNMGNYDETYRRFLLDVPEYFNYTTDIIEKWAEDPERIALVIADDHGESLSQYTFSQLSAWANQFAQAILRLGIRKGDRVLVILPRIHEWYVALLGMFKIGVIPVPTTCQCTSRDLSFRFGKAQAVAVVAGLSDAAKIDEIASQCPTLRHKILVDSVPDRESSWLSFHNLLAAESPSFSVCEKTRSDDPMILYFTSGTVAYPKMVVHTQASYGIAHETTARFWQDIHPEDLHWTISDTGWAKAVWGCLFGQWRVGARVFLHNHPRFEPKTTLKLLSTAGITTFCAPPTVYRILVHENLQEYKFPTLQHCVSAGEPLNPETIRLWKQATGLMIYNGYGQTETTNLIANYASFPVRQGSLGKPVPGFEISLLDEQGSPVDVGNEGQMTVKISPNRPVGLFAGYWDDKENTRKVLSGEWYLTGDKAYMDEEGYFWFVGRNDDVILTAGYRIGPCEVENILMEHPAVLEAAVVSSPDALRGEVIKAFIRLKPGYCPDHELAKAIQQFVRETTAPYKYPRLIELVDDFPKTISGKIRRGELRRREWEQHAAID